MYSFLHPDYEFVASFTTSHLNSSFLQIKQGKIWTLPQIFSKSNYVFEHIMITK